MTTQPPDLDLDLDDELEARLQAGDRRLAQVNARIAEGRRKNWGPIVSWATIERNGVKSGWPLYKHDIDAMRARSFEPGVTTIIIDPNS